MTPDEWEEYPELASLREQESRYRVITNTRGGANRL